MAPASRDEAEGMGGFPSLHGLAAEQSNAAEHRHHTSPTACAGVEAKLRHLEKSVLNQGGFSLKAQPWRGRSCPSHCREGPPVLCPQPREGAQPPERVISGCARQLPPGTLS